MATKSLKRKIKTGSRKERPAKRVESSSSSDENDSDNEVTTGNAGWADSIAKVLNTNKPKAKKTIVLSKAKKVAPKPKDSSDAISFEIDGEIKEEKPDKDELDQQVKKLKNQSLGLRVKPTSHDFERERTLRKIGTRGVVQLFNAVRIQQKDIDQQLKEAGPLDSKRDAVLNNIDKKKFLDVLMGGKRSKSVPVDNPVKEEKSDNEEEEQDDGKKKGWNVLRDDYMTNKKIKHWDEEDSGDDKNDSSDQGDNED